MNYRSAHVHDIRNTVNCIEYTENGKTRANNS